MSSGLRLRAREPHKKSSKSDNHRQDNAFCFGYLALRAQGSMSAIRQWIFASFAIFGAFFVAGVGGPVAGSLLGSWDTPVGGFCAALAVVLATYFAAPNHKLLLSCCAFVLGAVFAWRFLEPSWYPYNFGDRSYKQTHWPVMTTYAGGLLALLFAGILRPRSGPYDMIASLLRDLLGFGLVGPLIGLVCVVIQDPAGLAFRPSLLLGLALSAYVFGLAPALATGLVAWTLRYRLRRYLGGPVCGAIGAVTAAPLLAPTPFNAQSLIEGLQLGMLPGGVAGLVCGLIYFWPPDNSFKPRPLRGSA